MPKLPILAIFTCTVVLTSCGRICDEYKYFDLSTMRGAVIEESRVPDNPRVERQRPFPVRYSFRRDEYLLQAIIEPKGGLPIVRFDVKPSSDIGLELRLQELGKNIAHCITVSGNKVPAGSVRLIWVGGPGCETLETVRLNVVNDNGDSIAFEIVPIDLVPNGRWCEPDAP